MLKKVIAMLLTSVMVLSGTVMSFAEEIPKQLVAIPLYEEDILEKVIPLADDTRVETRIFTGIYQGGEDIYGKTYSYNVKVIVRYELEISPFGRRIVRVNSVDSNDGDGSHLKKYSHKSGWGTYVSDDLAEVYGMGTYIGLDMGNKHQIDFSIGFDNYGKRVY